MSNGSLTAEQLNVRIAQRVWDEVWHEGNFRVIDELFDPHFVRHEREQGQDQDRGQNAQFIRRMRAAFPDLHYTVDDVIASGDKVVMRYHFEGTHLGDALGFPPTGKKAGYTGMLIQRFANGKIIEQWTEWNSLSLFEQLGQVTMRR
jgi:steroid delta-isomerase-like uncharacterized protein